MTYSSQTTTEKKHNVSPGGIVQYNELERFVLFWWWVWSSSVSTAGVCSPTPSSRG